IFNLVRPAPEKKLPVILSRAEVRQILAGVRRPGYRVCLATIYSCSLRLPEGTNLRVPDIDSARLMIHVRHGKGAKDRYVPLPERTLQLLRQYWKQHHNPVLLFPAESRKFPTIAKSWRSNWARVIPFFAHPPEIRRVIYTTNAIESLNMSLRKVTKARGSFPNDEAVFKLLFLALRNIAKKWTMPVHDWKAALNRFAIVYENRLPVE